VVGAVALTGGSGGLGVDDDAGNGAAVQLSGTGEEIRTERDETLPEVTHTSRGKLATVLAGHQLKHDLTEVLVDPCEAGEKFAVTLDHGRPPSPWRGQGTG
jgi:hypothetical protein